MVRVIMEFFFSFLVSCIVSGPFPGSDEDKSKSLIFILTTLKPPFYIIKNFLIENHKTGSFYNTLSLYSEN